MVPIKTSLVALGTTAALLTVAACGGGSSGGAGNATSTAKGGTLYDITSVNAEHTDPQRMYLGKDISNLGRTVYRSLVAFPVTDNADKANTPVPDLATDTGTSKQGGRVWSFTLKDGVKWQDGKPVTCADLKYGVSRTFATDVITGGPNYMLSFLDVPVTKDGLPLYNGPYKNAHAADFDKAVTCSSDDKTITYRFNKPWPDFPLAVASLRAFDPYRKDKDQGDKSNLQIFSDGPYKLQGKWQLGKGGTLVRNNQWDAKTDTIRKALPDKIVFQEGLEDEVIDSRLIADSGNDAAAVTDRTILPSDFSQINGPVADRAKLTLSPYVYYLQPNFNRIKNVKVRQALAMSTNAQGYVDALGGDKAATVAKSVVNPALVGYQPNPAASQPASGDAAAAKKLLQQSGEKMPYPITYTYSRRSNVSDKAAGALAESWKQAGFKVTLDPLTETYYDVVDKPTGKSDVVLAGWGADWPAISSVIPALFDSRINLTSESNGQDYGNYRSDKVNSLIDKAAQQSSVEAAAKVYEQADQELAKDVAYIPVYVQKCYILHGSKVTNYVANPATQYLPDMAALGVSK